MTIRPVASVSRLGAGGACFRWRVERVRLPPVLTIARLQYDGGGDWYANPSSLPNLLAAIRQRTSLQVDKTEARVTLMDDKLWDYPFIHVTGHGNIKFSDAEIVRLREYLASAAASCTSTTTMGSMKAFVARSSACFRTVRSSTCR